MGYVGTLSIIRFAKYLFQCFSREFNFVHFARGCSESRARMFDQKGDSLGYAGALSLVIIIGCARHLFQCFYREISNLTLIKAKSKVPDRKDDSEAM